MLPEENPAECKWAEFPEFNQALGREPLFRGISNADLQWVYPSTVRTLARFGKDMLIARHYGAGVVVCSSIIPWAFDEKEIALRVNRRRAQWLMSRLVANLGGAVDANFGYFTDADIKKGKVKVRGGLSLARLMSKLGLSMR